MVKNKKIIHTVFAETARTFPDKTAVSDPAGRITYRDLEAAANALAGTLSAVDGQGGGVAASLFEAGISHVVVMLATFKAGLIFMPVSQKFKARHFDKIYHDIKPSILLAGAESLDLVNELQHRYPHKIEYLFTITPCGKKAVMHQWAGHGFAQTDPPPAPFPEPAVAITPETANYLFFTSGTTGLPKAIVGQHKSLSHFIHWETAAFSVDEHVRVSQLTEVTFDASLRDIWLPLMNGGELVIPPAALKQDAAALLRWIGEQRITMVHTVPTVFRTLLGAPGPDGAIPGLQYVLLAGEMLYNKDILQWRARFGNTTRLVNLYGPTETTMVKTFYVVEDVPPDPNGRVPAGKPISSTAVLVINEENGVCAVNEEGDIYIKTPFATKGYFGDPEATSQAFVQNPLHHDFPDPVYKTGDRGKYLPGYDLLVLGRRDDVVKINGVRISLGDVEQALLRFPLVGQVKCLQYLDSIACYYTHAPQFNRQDFLAFAEERLTAYEKPAYFFAMEAFPLNANGKLDIRGLPSPNALLGEDRAGFVKPVSAIEITLARLWTEVLGNAVTVGVTDDFFYLGGQSLKANVLLYKINKCFSLDLTLGVLFENRTIDSQARVIRTSGGVALRSVQKTPLRAHYPASNAQNRIWLACRNEAGSVAYHMPRVIALEGEADPAHVQECVRVLLRKHEALRTRFELADNGELRQYVVPWEELDVVLGYTDATGYSAQQLNACFAAKASVPFDLSAAPLLKADLIRTAPQTCLLYIVIHHIACDEHSMQVLREDFFRAYHGLPAVAGNGFQYKDYAVWSKEGPPEEDARAYWKQMYADPMPGLTLPFARGAQGDESWRGKRVVQPLDAALLQRINAFTAAHHLAGSAFFTGCLCGLLYQYTGQTDLVIGTVVTERNRAEFEHVVGPFMNVLPVRYRLDPSWTAVRWFEAVADLSHAAYRYTHFPFEQIMEWMQHPGGEPVQVALNVINSAAPGSAAAGQEAGYGSAGYAGSKFPLCLYVVEQAPGIQLLFEYRTDRFEESAIGKFAGRFTAFIEEVMENPGRSLARLRLNKQVMLPDLF